MAATHTTSTRDPLPAGTAGLEAWKTLVIAHSRLFRALDVQMSDEHGRALGDYDVLVQLAGAPGQSLRMCDLASAVLLSPSGLSRRVERLERDGLVERRRAEGDGRNIEATLTAAGRRLFRRLQATHHQGIKELFADEFSEAELDALSELLARLNPEPAPAGC
jgi:DNA-binding MarR family transcriptional regulator